MNLASDLLFDGHNNKSYLFTMLRHPVDRTLLAYYDFIQSTSTRTTSSSESEGGSGGSSVNLQQQMTLQEYIESPYMDQNRNWLTRFLVSNRDSNVNVHVSDNLNDRPVDLDREHLNLAKEILRTKCLVGLYELLDESVELFTAYFGGWDRARDTTKDMELNEECVSNHINDSFKKTEEIHEKLIYQKYNIKYGSDIYNDIVRQNEYDMDLYWYAFDLQKARQNWIESQ